MHDAKDEDQPMGRHVRADTSACKLLIGNSGIGLHLVSISFFKCALFMDDIWHLIPTFLFIPA